jgi:hypothetical protein
VDVRLVREVAGIVATDGADGGVIVACGTFSPRARPSPAVHMSS